ncbi:hypothetical protein Cadr_000011605 [Camelus dromedarius]|uniref:Uncharacterized protein n=1 Tax=Camelus dromedarius TaxID=9838 RepID=A0A5N4DV39_CAMDR|nr:hypothetical protein Cadr_000011605 [Camelus dromedarius]
MVGFISVFFVFSSVFVPSAFVSVSFLLCVCVCLFVWINWTFFRILFIYFRTPLRTMITVVTLGIRCTVCLRFPLYRLTQNAGNSPHAF